VQNTASAWASVNLGKLARRTLLSAISLLSLTCLPAAAAEKGSLLVWINGDKGYEGIARIAEDFTRATGVAVRVEHPENAVSKFEQAAAAGKGPDIWIWPHDRAGSWANSGLISPVAPSRATRNAIMPMAWQAWQMGGKTWGYPVAIEALALIYNKDLVAKAPETWDEVFALEQKLKPQGKHAIMWPFNEFYYTYGLISAAGGYAFGRRADGSFDPLDVGINTDGTARGLDILMQLIDSGVVPRTATYAESEAAVNEGRVAMTINGPWAWNNLKKSKIRFGAAAFPKVDGRAGGPMVGVLGAMVSSASPNAVLATEFIESYLLSLPGLRAMNAHVPLGVPANQALYDELKADPLIAGTYAAAVAGSTMPNIPDMARFWSAMNAAVQNIAQGREAVRPGLARAAQRVTGAK
ncbi:maltose/maltodextrin ABC transporter substrate-binding protein MalE, partial [Ideonella sp.]|uniref:maltose/maltodextrin ABC transporter substrate-binding protein MalE n=1 Tax=Ideonella sp. TaxID=1929293 RepID=UPI003BB5F33D